MAQSGDTRREFLKATSAVVGVDYRQLLGHLPSPHALEINH